MIKTSTIFFYCFLSNAMCLAQDTTTIIFQSVFHLEHDYRNYDNDLSNQPLFQMVSDHYDLPDGQYVFMDSVKNIVRLKGEVIDGNKNGKWLYFDNSGKLRMEDIYFNDFDETHLTTIFDTNSRITQLKESSLGFTKNQYFNSDGLTFYYYQNNRDSNDLHMSFDTLGRINYQMSMRKGKKHGLWSWTYDDGTLYTKQYYDNGKKEGVWISGFKGETKVWCEEVYQQDKLVSISFYSKVKYQINPGKTEIIDTYPNGKMRLSGVVENGVKIGVWRFYNSDGTEIAQFKHDEFGNIISLSGDLEGIPGI